MIEQNEMAARLQREESGFALQSELAAEARMVQIRMAEDRIAAEADPEIHFLPKTLRYPHFYLKTPWARSPTANHDAKEMAMLERWPIIPHSAHSKCTASLYFSLSICETCQC